MKTKQQFLSMLLMAIVMMAMSPMKMWADENPTLQLGKNVVTVYGWSVFNFTAEKAGTYRFHSEGNVDLNVSEFNGVGVFSSGAQGDNDVDGINFDWSIALDANSTNTIEIYVYDQTQSTTENCVVYVTYVGEGGGSGEGSGGSGEESNNIKIELPIRLYDKDGNVLSYYIYNANTAYFNLGSEKRSSHNQLSSGEYTFTAEDNVYGFSFVGWYDDDGNLINTEKTFTQNVENNILYLPHYKAKETTVIPDNRSFVSLEAIIEGEGEATFELDGYQGASIVFVNTGTEVTAKATSTSNTASCKISGNAEVDEGLKYYSTTESSLTFTVLGNTGLVALFSADSESGGSGSGGDSGSGGETTTSHVLNVGNNAVNIYEYDSEDAEDDDYLYTFTPTETGTYTFTFTDNDGPIAVCADFGQEVSDMTVLELSDFTVALTAETTYTLYVDGDLSDYESATINISKVEGTAALPKHEREMAYEWGTVCLPFPVTYDAKNGTYKLYTLTAASATELTFTEIADGTNIAGGTPMAIKAVGKKNAETGKYNISITGSGATDFSATPKEVELENGYTMKGTFYRHPEDDCLYFIAQNKFWYAESPITIPAYRAYIEGPEQTSHTTKVLNIVVADEADGIKAVNSEQLTVNNGKFIENGKVVVVKNGKKFNVNGQRVR